jgi:hypothetical protein
MSSWAEAETETESLKSGKKQTSVSDASWFMHVMCYLHSNFVNANIATIRVFKISEQINLSCENICSLFILCETHR